MKLFPLLALIAGAATAIAVDEVADSTAKFLAGLPVRGTPAEPFTQGTGWAHHATEFDRAWEKVEQLQLAKIRVWAPQYLGDAYTSRNAMFYMFSGPDFLYANAFFPNASTYFLCGIEPVGTVPQLDKIPPAVLASSLANLRKSLESSLNWSFFITKNMKVDLTQTQLNGTLPVLFVFLARAGCAIDSVELVSVSRDGELAPPVKGNAPGVKIGFSRGADQPPQTLYYFASDLSDSGVRANPGFLKLCGKQSPGLTLLKAASYLMHEESFSKVRSFLLANSGIILQDDSGIPYRFFPEAGWKVRFCGHFAGPIDLFKKCQQPDLGAAFKSSVPVPIEFGFGYQWHPSRSSLMIATPQAKP